MRISRLLQIATQHRPSNALASSITIAGTIVIV
jgi:hypothetical protein